jgi:guanylate kinase
MAGLLLVISGPSGVGKTTITRALREAFDDSVFSVSATTRGKTAADTDGVDYHFLSDDAFDARVAEGAFLEHATYAGNRYGTLRAPVDEALDAGRLMILDIDVQGAIEVRRKMPEAFGVFILPPCEDTLLQRLRDRKRDTEEAIQRRFAAAKREIETARTCGAYDAFVVNDHLASAINETIDLVTAERARRSGA